MIDTLQKSANDRDEPTILLTHHVRQVECIASDDNDELPKDSK
ncbi:Hypothetical protein SMB2099_1796 [Serratia marcescens SMB2099]|nr:Hypothetical protein SMB2099_1796 [Serratia marcescens SMB2099]DAL44507.1 MAG TPA_asm: hypothetical protein [Caudoviricetes sp.]